MSQTVIGPGTRIAGALSGQDDLIVEGQVDGPIHGEAAVVIKAGARVGGAVRGRDVTIAGELAHAVYATNIVRLAATAKLTGDIEAPRISIDEGAVFEGQVRMRKPAPVSAAAVSAAPASAAAVSAATVSVPAPAAVPARAAVPAPAVAALAPAAAAARPAAAPAQQIVQTHNKPREIVQAHNNPPPPPQPSLRAIPDLAVPGRKRLIRKTP